MTTAPDHVLALAAERTAARAAKDFARSDELRAEIAEFGWVVKDTAEGVELTQKPPFVVHATLAALLATAPSLPEAACTMALLVDGWADDLETCIRALMANSDDRVTVVALDCGGRQLRTRNLDHKRAACSSPLPAVSGPTQTRAHRRHGRKGELERTTAGG